MTYDPLNFHIYFSNPMHGRLSDLFWNSSIIITFEAWIGGSSGLDSETIEYIDLWHYNLTEEDGGKLADAGAFEHQAQIMKIPSS